MIMVASTQKMFMVILFHCIHVYVFKNKENLLRYPNIWEKVSNVIINATIVFT